MIVTPTLTGGAAGPVDPLPQSDPKYFTAKSPTLATVNSYLTHQWGYEDTLLWRVMGILPTKSDGVSEVIVFVLDTSKPDAKPQRAVFYVLPDGKYAIGAGAGLTIFGADPFADLRNQLKQRANGPARGSASKDLLLVEFADLQCPYCAKVQDTVDQIVKDFPGARVVFQQRPLVDIHSSAFKATAYGICVQKLSDEDFFKYAAGVFDTQGGLTPATEDTILKAAVKRAGLDSDAIATCADTQATKDAVNADIKLGDDVGIVQTPTLSINGRLVPLGIDYETLKKMIVFQAKLDGVATGAAPDILTPKPTLSTLPK
jgi:protein-disulfide isomerase